MACSVCRRNTHRAPKCPLLSKVSSRDIALLGGAHLSIEVRGQWLRVDRRGLTLIAKICDALDEYDASEPSADGKAAP